MSLGPERPMIGAIGPPLFAGVLTRWTPAGCWMLMRHKCRAPGRGCRWSLTTFAAREDARPTVSYGISLKMEPTALCQAAA